MMDWSINSIREAARKAREIMNESPKLPTVYLMTNAILEEMKSQIPTVWESRTSIINLEGIPIEAYETEAEVTARRIILEAAGERPQVIAWGKS